METYRGEFISFSNFELNEYINCDRVEDLNIELPILREYFNEIYIAISDPLIRQKVFNLLKSNNIIVDTYIHPSVIVGKKYCYWGRLYYYAKSTYLQ